ncbi:uncharacterized protein V1518DRAFT_434703 [Limtongia smithiae]|uniref:uncharacterized protein n=1 Tax=Limtongia smithiae TaxID=1125753 RepID=UPI0034CFE022
MAFSLYALINSLISGFLFIICAVILIYMYTWALRPVLAKYTAAIPLHDISGYLRRTAPSLLPLSNSTTSGAIALAGPDELLPGVGVSNLAREGVVETRRHFGWEQEYDAAVRREAKSAAPAGKAMGRRRGASVSSSMTGSVTDEFFDSHSVLGVPATTMSASLIDARITDSASADDVHIVQQQRLDTVSEQE